MTTLQSRSRTTQRDASVDSHQGVRPALCAPKITRRGWAAGVLGSAAAAAQAPPAKPQTAEQFLEAQRQQVDRNAGLLAKHKLPVETEPAFVFKP